MLPRISIAFLIVSVSAGLMFAQAPAITAGGTVNAASNAAGQPVAPGGLVSIYGTNFAAGLALASSVPLSTSLSGTSVSINGIAAPLDFVSPGQINAQVPFNVLPAGTNGSVNVLVTNGSLVSAASPVTINQVGPGIFGDANLTPEYAIAYYGLGTDPRFGTLAWPPNTVGGLTTSLAHPGDVLTILATGLGAVTPSIQNGAASSDQLRSTSITPTVLVGNVAATLYFSGLSPQFPGVYQLNIAVPQIPAGNAVPIQIQMNGVTSPATVFIGVANP